MLIGSDEMEYGEDDGEVVIIDGYTYWHKVLVNPTCPAHGWLLPDMRRQPMSSTFPIRLQSAREFAGMSLQGLADASGTSHSSVRLWLAGRAEPSIGNSAKLAEASQAVLAGVWVSAQCPSDCPPADQPGLAVASPVACAAVAGKASSLILLAIGTVGLAVERLQARRRALLQLGRVRDAGSRRGFASSCGCNPHPRQSRSWPQSWPISRRCCGVGTGWLGPAQGNYQRLKALRGGQMSNERKIQTRTVVTVSIEVHDMQPYDDTWTAGSIHRRATESAMNTIAC